MSLLARNLSKLVSSTSRRGLAVTSTLKADLSMPDPLEHATGKTRPVFLVENLNLLWSGLEKYELLAKEAGNEDPFFLKAVKRTKGTKDTPTIIHAMDNYRMVGCVCNEEDTNIKWTWLSEVCLLCFF